MPGAWGIEGSTTLSRLWELGGTGAVSVLPVLGQYAPLRMGKNLLLSKQEIARLAGIDPTTVGVAANVMSGLGLLQSEISISRSMSLTKWRLSESLFAAGDREAQDYFSFRARLVHGGNWSMLSAIQRLLYLAIATQARKYEEAFCDNKLMALLPEDCPRHDLASAYAQDGWVRLAMASYSQIGRIAGLAQSSVAKAVSQFRADRNSEEASHIPLAVYTGLDGINIYHFRDHASHWPWDSLNAGYVELAA